MDSKTLDEQPDDLLSLEFEGVREVDLGDSKLTLMVLRWTSDESAEASFLRLVINSIDGEEHESD